MRRWFERANRGKAVAMAAIGEFCAADIVYHDSHGKDILGLNDLKQYNSEFFTACPDVHFTIDDMVVEGDKVVTRWTMTGTHKGEIGGLPPTNKKFTIWGITIDRIAGGKVVEEWERSDTLGSRQQLGLMPASQKS